MNVRPGFRSSIILTALLLCGAWLTLVRAVEHDTSTGVELLMPSDAGSALPPGLSLPENPQAPGHVVRVVAADIDDDGDLDVIENDGSLQLTVWENDGAGHLTKMR